MAVAARIGALAAALAVFVAAGPALAQAQGGNYGHPHMWDGGGWWMFLGPLWMIIVIGLLIAGIVLLVRWLGGGPVVGGHGPAASGRALDILKERFARGEIDEEEFEKRRRLLE